MDTTHPDKKDLATDQLTHPKYRQDIDGLRAIAVLSVVGFHTFPNLVKGGFVGVDIFFVISGFLISIIIFGSLEKNSFTFFEFYSRRICRIFPALIIILSATFAFGWFALYPGEYKLLAKHLVGGATFSSNFILLNESGYFDTASETKPLLHLWSLGVEEQFYIIYPLLLWLAWKCRFNLFTVITFISLVSFILNLLNYKSNSDIAFYSPQTRFWELMLGASLAYITLRKHSDLAIFELKFNRWYEKVICSLSASKTLVSNAQSVLGMTIILFSILVISKEKDFPGWWAILPTTGALLTISSGSQAWINRKILSNPLLVWFGKISFPLYLWHWVIFSFSVIMSEGTPALKIKMSSIAISILLAWLTYKLIEKPLRYGNFRQTKTICLIALMVFLGSIGYINFNGQGIFIKNSLTLNSQQINSKAEFSWEASLNSSLECINKFGSEFGQYCVIDDISKQPEILLLGDSNANHLVYGLSKATKGTNLLMLGQGGCLPFIGVTTRQVEGEFNCEKAMNKAFKYAISEKSIKTVVLSMMGAGFINEKRSLNGGFIDIHFVNDNKGQPKSIIFKEGMKQTLNLLTSAKKNIIFIVSTPRMNFHPRTCLHTRPLSLATIKKPCAITRAIYEEDNKEYRDAVFSVLNEFPQVKVFDSATELCDKEYCYAMKNGKVYYRDDIHLSLQGSLYLGQKIVEATKIMLPASLQGIPN